MMEHTTPLTKENLAEALQGLAEHLDAKWDLRLDSKLQRFATKDDFVGFRDEFLTITGGLQTSISGLETKTDGLQSSIADLQTKTDGLQTSITNLETKTDGLQTSISGLEAKTDGLQTAISALETKTDGLQTSIANLETKTDALQLKTDGLQSEITGLKAATDGLQTKTDNLQTRTKEIAMTVARLEGGMHDVRDFLQTQVATKRDVDRVMRFADLSLKEMGEHRQLRSTRGALLTDVVEKVEDHERRLRHIEGRA